MEDPKSPWDEGCGVCGLSSAGWVLWVPAVRSQRNGKNSGIIGLGKYIWEYPAQAVIDQLCVIVNHAVVWGGKALKPIHFQP